MHTDFFSIVPKSKFLNNRFWFYSITVFKTSSSSSLISSGPFETVTPTLSFHLALDLQIKDFKAPMHPPLHGINAVTNEQISRNCTSAGHISIPKVSLENHSHVELRSSSFPQEAKRQAFILHLHDSHPNVPSFTKYTLFTFFSRTLPNASTDLLLLDQFINLTCLLWWSFYYCLANFSIDHPYEQVTYYQNPSPPTKLFW